MNKLLKIMSHFKAAVSVEEDGSESITITGLASTDSVDRAGDIILHSAWDAGGLDSYRKNPIVLFNHDYDEPIGKVTDIQVVAEGLKVTAKIYKAAEEIFDFVKQGVLTTFSVGFLPKEMDYNKITDGFIIKKAELLELSIVSVPCNQTALFSVAKSFATTNEYDEFKKVYLANKEVNASELEENALGDANASMENKIMDPEEIKKIAEAAANKAVADERAAVKAAAEAAAAKEAATAEIKTAVSAGLTSGAERLYADLEVKMAAREADVAKVLSEGMADIKAASEELTKMRDSKRQFGGNGGSGSSWKADKAIKQEVEDAYILGLASLKGFAGTSFGKEVINKVNAHSGVEVSSADFEQEVSTNIERDIQLQLVLAPLFREITMRSATQIIPILPDAGYAEITSNQAAAGSSPHGNIATRGDTFGSPYGGNDLTEVSLSTIKLISQSYLGNETEEDAILPILPLIRDTIVRSHARGVENAMLAGNHADGVYTSGAFNGLIKLASSSRTTQSATAYASDVLTGDQLLAARKNMGKYGINPRDVSYIVSLRAYYELLQDVDFQDWTQVQDMGTKMTGEVGSIFGSKVLVCDEFATPAVSKYSAIAVNTRNFVVPRLRGMRMESQYEAANQRTVIIGSQRIGFSEIIAGATSVWGLQYKAT